MGHWFDFGTVLPPAGQLVSLRRYPEDTPPYFGIFDVAAAQATTSVGTGYTLLTPWASLTHWATLQGIPGHWPQQPPTGTPWRDPFWCPPTDGQHVWIRRFRSDTASVAANWDYAAAAYVVQDTGWQLPWHQVWKWKPR